MNYIFYMMLIGGLIYWVENPHWVFPNSLIIRKKGGADLEVWLKKFNWNHRQDLSGEMKLPVYKFYTETIEVLLKLARKMGGNYQDSFLFIREGLQLDQQFEKKIRESILGTWIQMGLMMGLTWIFILGALHLVEVKIASFHLLLIFLWQSVGLSLLPLILKFLRGHYFGDIGKLWKMLLILKALAKVPVSRTEVFQFAGVGELNQIKQKTLGAVVEKLKETCQKALKIGGSYEDEVKYLMEELRFQEKWHFELFEKRLVVIKLGLLSLFFLPSYLAFIFLLLSDLMALM